jgi:hypothetical protein
MTSVDILGITLNDDKILPFQRVQNTIGCDMFKPSQDKVLLAMSQRHPNVIYLNQDGQPHPRDTFAVQSARLHEEYGDGDKDLRPLLVDFPVNTDKRFLGAVGPSDDTTLMWPHQLYQIMEVMTCVEQISK